MLKETDKDKNCVKRIYIKKRCDSGRKWKKSRKWKKKKKKSRLYIENADTK